MRKYQGYVVRRAVSRDSIRENWAMRRGRYMVLEFPRVVGRAIFRGIGGGGGFVRVVYLWLVVDMCSRIQRDNPTGEIVDGEGEDHF